MTELQENLLRLISDKGVLTRKDIADEWEKTRLNPHDVDMLEDLVSRGLIKRGSKLIGTVRTVFIYQIVHD